MFKLKKENKSIKDKIVRDIMTLFEKEEDYYKPIKVDIFIATVILNMKVIVKKKRFYRSKNTSIKLNHT